MSDDLSDVIQQALFYAIPLMEDTDLVSSASGLVTPEALTPNECFYDAHSSMSNYNNELKQNADISYAGIESNDGTVTKNIIDDLIFNRYTSSNSVYHDKESFNNKNTESPLDIESDIIDNKQIKRKADSVFDEGSNGTHDKYTQGNSPALIRGKIVPPTITEQTVSSSVTTDNTVTPAETPSCEEPKVKKRRKREKNSEPYPDPVLPPCIICNEKASGFHYGANTCEACKGFFRRSLERDKSWFKCRCQPDLREQWKRGPVRNGCSLCRYNRCIKEGMSKDAIKIGRYTIKHKTNNINQIKSAEAIDVITDVAMVTSEPESSRLSSSSDVCDSASEIYSSSTTGSRGKSVVSASSQTDFDHVSPEEKKKNTIQDDFLTSEEIELIVTKLTEAQTNSNNEEECNVPIEIIKQKQTDYLEKYNMKKQMFGNMTLSNEEFQEFYNITGIDLDGRIQHMTGVFNYLEQKIFKIVDFAKAIPGFKRLSLNDQANLIKASRAESKLFGGYKARYRNFDLDNRVVTTPWGKEIHLDELAKIHPIQGLLSQYEQCRLLVNLKLTVQEDAVIRAIATMFSDRCPLEEPYKVEHIQEKLVTCLQHLLNARPDGPGTLLYRIFNFLVNLRNFSENESKFKHLLMRDYPMLCTDKYQLLKEFMS